MKRLLLILSVAALITPVFTGACWAKDMAEEDSTTENSPKTTKTMEKSNSMMDSTMPENFKKLSTLTSLPEMMPGLGMLYVDPATMPMGPYLGYDKDHNLINIVYMIPLKQLDDHKNFASLGGIVGKKEIDHTDILFNAGHAGLDEAHYQIVQWLISPDEVEKRLK